MMGFRSAKTGLANILKAAAAPGGYYAGKYQVIDYQKEVLSAEEVANNNRSVQVYYDAGEFSGPIYGPTHHKVTFKLDLIVGTSGSVDLSGLDLATTDAERAAILANHKEALAAADENLDELIEMIYQTVMSGDNIDFGLDNIISSRNITRVQKNEPLPRGEYAIVSATMTLECMVTEELISTDETDATTMDATIKISGDDTGLAAVENDIS